jgi:hypothetical protein
MQEIEQKLYEDQPGSGEDVPTIAIKIFFPAKPSLT